MILRKMMDIVPNILQLGDIDHGVSATSRLDGGVALLQVPGNPVSLEAEDQFQRWDDDSLPGTRYCCCKLLHRELRQLMCFLVFPVSFPGKLQSHILFHSSLPSSLELMIIKLSGWRNRTYSSSWSLRSIFSPGRGSCWLCFFLSSKQRPYYWDSSVYRNFFGLLCFPPFSCTLLSYISSSSLLLFVFLSELSLIEEWELFHQLSSSELVLKGLPERQLQIPATQRLQ